MFLEIRNYIAVGFALMLISPAASVITELQKSLTSFLMIRFIHKVVTKTLSQGVFGVIGIREISHVAKTLLACLVKLISS